MLFFSEALWGIKEVAKNRSDVAREVVAVANKFLGISNISPETLYKLIHSGLTESQKKSRNQNVVNSDEECLFSDENEIDN